MPRPLNFNCFASCNFVTIFGGLLCHNGVRVFPTLAGLSLPYIPLPRIMFYVNLTFPFRLRLLFLFQNHPT